MLDALDLAPRYRLAEVGEDARALEKTIELLLLRVLAGAGLAGLLRRLLLNEQRRLEIGLQGSHFAGELGEFRAVIVGAILLVELRAHLVAELRLPELELLKSRHRSIRGVG